MVYRFTNYALSGVRRISYFHKKNGEQENNMKVNIFEKSRNNHEIFDALYDAYKFSNRLNEKILRIDDIRNGCSEKYHSTLEEECVELNQLLKKATGKVLYLNYLTDGKLLTRQYNKKDSTDCIQMVQDFLKYINEEIVNLEIAE